MCFWSISIFTLRRSLLRFKSQLSTTCLLSFCSLMLGLNLSFRIIILRNILILSIIKFKIIFDRFYNCALLHKNHKLYSFLILFKIYLGPMCKKLKLFCRWKKEIFKLITHGIQTINTYDCSIISSMLTTTKFLSIFIVLPFFNQLFFNK